VLVSTYLWEKLLELSVRYPKSAGEALYVNAAFSNSFLSKLVGWAVITTGIVSAATLVNGFAGYLGVFVQIPEALAICLAVIVITVIACWGILESVSIAAIITLIEVVGLILVILALRNHIYDIPSHWETLLPPPESGVWLGIMMGAFIAFYAFIGFEDMVNVIEEVIEPAKNMPKAIIIALVVASLFYFIVALVAVLASTPEELNLSHSPMVDLIQADYPVLAKSVGVISIIAIVNGALVQIIMGSRLLYGMANQNIAPKIFQSISAVTRTPVLSTLAIGLIVLFFSLALPLLTLAKVTSFIIVLVFLLVNISLILIRLQELKEAKIGTKLKCAMRPIVASALCICLILVPVLRLI